MYKALEALRAGETLEGRLRKAHDDGLVSVLLQLHDDLDALVAAAYGWPADLLSEEVLSNLVTLNVQRASEEEAGMIRWLRPELQNPEGRSSSTAKGLNLDVTERGAVRARLPWPKDPLQQIGVVRDYLHAAGQPLTAGEIAKGFQGATSRRVEPLLDSLIRLGLVQASEGRQPRFSA